MIKRFGEPPAFATTTLHGLLHQAWSADRGPGYDKEQWKVIEPLVKGTPVQGCTPEIENAAWLYLDLRPGRAAMQLREALLANMARSSFHALWKVSDLKGDSDRVFNRVRELYYDERRHYHTLEHVCSVLDKFTVLVNSDGFRINQGFVDTTNLRLGLWAIWFHDVQIEFKAGDEEVSAAYAAGLLTACGMDAASVECVEKLILATAYVAPAETELAKAVVDADLSILGAEPDYFDAYELRVRAEWPKVSDADFAVARAQILRGFLARPSVFQTAAGRELWEGLARVNLTRSIAKLEKA